MKCDSNECQHIWDYKGELINATCPSCGKKVNVKNNQFKTKEVKKNDRINKK